MVTINGYTAEHMKAIEDGVVVSGTVVGDNLVLTKRDGSTITAGNVRGGTGAQGVPGSITASPASGDLSGNYPSPTIAALAVTDAKVAAANKDGAAATPSMRTLGTGAQQAAAGNHNHGDSGWIDIVPLTAGDAPFGTKLPVYLQYRKFGPWVHVRFRKDSAGTIDRTTNTGGNFPNVAVFPAGTIPAVACPTTYNVTGSGTFVDSPAGLVITPTGAIYWVGGFARNYNAGSAMIGDFAFMA